MKDKLIDKIDHLLKTYEDDEFILSKLENYIINDLPNNLLIQKKNQIDRVERKSRLINSQDKFIQDFLSKNLYFFSNTSEIFFLL